MKAFLGTGLLGSGFVKAMLLKGDSVQVWNRTLAKAKPLEADGATVCEHVADAVKGAQFIHLTLKDDATVDEVLEAARPGFIANATIIDHTTTSVDGAIARTKKWAELGYTYLHAPVFMGPANAEQSTGSMLVSGNQSVIADLKDQLSAMTGKLINLGEAEGKAAGMKLTGNLFLIALTAGLSDALTLARASGISATEVTDLFTDWNPAASLSGRLNRMSGEDFSKPSWELDMARKDTGLMLSEAEKNGVQLTVIPAVAALMDSFIAKGLGNQDWMIIGSDKVGY
ncbi:MAG: NAD(P)-dependent oxidoreductase [Bacteroidota bacterium]